MFIQILIVFFSGAFLVSSEDEVVLRIDFKKIFHEILKTFEDAAQQLSGQARENLQKYKNVFLEIEREIKTDLIDLKEYLQDRLNDAKKYGQKKFEEVKAEVKRIFETKQVESQEKIRDLHQKVVKLLNEEKQH